MKKLFVLFVSLFAVLSVVKADDDKAIHVDQLPSQAKQFISQYFSGSKVAVAKMEKDFFDKNYDVIFADGNKVEFNKEGVWREVDCRYSIVPAAIIPSAIRSYVSSHYAEAKIVQIERDRRDYEVKLDNGMKLKFDLKFNLIDIDN